MATAGLGVLALVAGTAGGIAALISDDDTRAVTAVGRAAPVVELPAAEAPAPSPTGQTGLGAGAIGHAEAEQAAGETRVVPGAVDRTATQAPSPRTTVDRGRTGGAAGAVGGAASAAAPAGPPAVKAPVGPRVRIKKVSRSVVIPFRTTVVRDASLQSGSRKVRTAGVPGRRLLRYAVTYTGSKETSRRLLSSAVTRTPKNRIVAVGTRKPVVDPPADGSGTDDSNGDGDNWDCQLLDLCGDSDDDDLLCGESDPFDSGRENFDDGELSPLDESDLDGLELVLPCEDDSDDGGDGGWEQE